MSYTLTTVTVKSTSAGKFVKDLPLSNKLRKQALALIELKKVAPGFISRDHVSVSEDGLTLTTVEEWETKEAFRAFKAEHPELEAYRDAAREFNAKQGNTVTITTA
jgi:heme-degrading monooxygenase HmoA